MSKVLVIDVGNTLVKLGVFHGGKIDVYKTDIYKLKTFLIATLKAEKDIKQLVLVAVADLDADIKCWLKEHYSIFVISTKQGMPFQNNYLDNNTLGSDRLALVSGAFCKYPSENVLIISMGTCITYDFIDAGGHYRGGAISPGMKMRLKSLEKFTAKLPCVDPEIPDTLIGDTTLSCIRSGVIWGLVDELEGAIKRYRGICKELRVVITGGDAPFFDKQLKSTIFACPNLLLEGAYALMKYNIHEI